MGLEHVIYGMLLDVWWTLQEGRNVLHAVGVISLLDAGGESAHLGVGILRLDPLMHFRELIDSRLLAVLQVALVSGDDVSLIFQYGW